MNWRLTLPLLFILPVSLLAEYRDIPTAPTKGDELLARYFEIETEKIESQSMAVIDTADDWNSMKGVYRKELEEMLGLNPMPERTPLNPVITGTTELDGVRIDRLHFQSRPGLYVTANFYYPEKREEKLPAILYVCGHAKVKKGGVSFGNKAGYHHHGLWFARNGYVCLTIDSLQLGEIEGIHHGTYRFKRWWWLNRGYTPAGVEAWNCIRALDYMETRPEVDAGRIGVTGRSGGGAYSWWVTALDERIKVSAPVAGITSMRNHVVDGVIEGHCDCMFHVNTYQWDFAQLAALAAPRPLLILNTDKDTIFPLDGVVDVYTKTRRIYKLLGKEGNIGLSVHEGPHKDTQPLRVPAFHWFERFLKGRSPDDELASAAAPKDLEPEQLRVFDSLPEDEINTEIDETFVGRPQIEILLKEGEEPSWADYSEHAMVQLREKSFRAWPWAEGELDVLETESNVRNGLRVTTYTFLSQEPFRLPLTVIHRDGAEPKEVTLKIVEEMESDPELNGDEAVAYVIPRGFGPTAWTSDAGERTHIRRRFALLGQTLDGMRVWDVRRAVLAIREIPGFKEKPITLQGSGTMAVHALYASLFYPELKAVVLHHPPTTHRNGPFYLNVSKFLEIPETVVLAAERTPLRIHTGEPDAWAFVNEMAAALEWEPGRFEIAD